MSRSRRLLRVATSLPVRIVVSAGLLAVVAQSIDWRAVADGLADARWWLFVLAVAVFLVAFVVAAVRWRALLVAAGVRTGFGETVRAYLIGMFANSLLPTGYGGDAVRGWVVAPLGKPLARSLTSVVMDRASGLACLLVIAWLALPVAADDVPGGIVILLAIATALAGLGALAALIVARRRGLGRFVPVAVRPWTAEVALVIRRYERDRRLLAFVFAIGFLYQAFVLGAFWLIAESLGLDLNPGILAIVVPPVLLAALLPISVAGFGVREGAFVVLLGEFGVSAADATLLSLLAVVAVTVASLPGGVAIAFGSVSALRS